MAEMDNIITPAKYALTYLGEANAIPAEVAQTSAGEPSAQSKENNKTHRSERCVRKMFFESGAL